MKRSQVPFFSPDGQWIGFFAAGKLKKTSVEGGGAIALCDASGTSFGGSWGADGTIIFALSTSALLRIPASGGTPAPVIELAGVERVQRWPQILPGGMAVLFTSHTNTFGFDAANVDVMSLADRHRKTLVRGGTFGRYMPSGHLVYINRGTLFAVPFDPERLELRGTPVPVLEQVDYNLGTGSAQLDFSRNGTLVIQSGGPGTGLVTVQWLESTGKTNPLLASIMVASYTVKGDSLVTDKPRVWSERRLGGAATSGNPNFDLAPDGKRIAALMPAGEPNEPKARNHVIFLLNFFDELRRRVPSGN